MKDKKIMVSAIIGIGVLVLLVLGATFAYFVVPVKNNFTKTNASSKIDSIGTVTLSPGSDISMEITSGQMMQMDTDVAYYGSSEGTTEEETSEIIATASVSGNGVFNCTYDLVMNATGTNNMYDAVQGMSDKEGQLILTVNGVRYDFSTTNLFPKTISGEMLGLTEGVNQELTAQLKLINKTGTEQNALIGTDINITFELQNFECSATEMGTSGTYVMETSPANISEELVNGLYRYQGTKDEVTNNYLCFMTTDKDECASNTGGLFRIIGITSDGQLKIIQNTYTGLENWGTGDELWPDSKIFPLLDSGVNNFSNEWKNLIVNKEWKYGAITSDEFEGMSNTSSSANEMVNKLISKENDFKNRINSKIGLISFEDLLLNDPNCYNDGLCESGWILLNNILGEDSATEWTAVKSDPGWAWQIYKEGLMQEETKWSLYYRPVGYLKSDLTLSGTGTIDDPYMIAI